jgi:saccharopine dehydrogenase-like NADP-dependent oxidoreductase
MLKRVLIIGGYGKVGGSIAQQLYRKTSLKIYVGGRSYEKANTFCEEYCPQAHPLCIDVRDANCFEFIPSVDLVIMCMEQENTDFVKYCLENGLHYVDITASYPFIQKIEELSTAAKKSTAIVSVGFAPGLSNLLVKDLAKEMRDIDDINISILLGLGENHGTGAIEWLLNQFNQSYYIQINESKEHFSNFSQRRTTQFNEIGIRSCYLFNFSDQHTLKRSFPLSEIRTYITFDIESINRLISLMHATRLTRLFRINWIKKVIVRAIQSLRLGSDSCAIKVEVNNRTVGQVNEIHQVFYGKNEAAMTATITTRLVENMIQHSLPFGVYHLDDLFELGDFLS